jgi:hypothetical protein
VKTLCIYQLQTIKTITKKWLTLGSSASSMGAVISPSSNVLAADAKVNQELIEDNAIDDEDENYNMPRLPSDNRLPLTLADGLAELSKVFPYMERVDVKGDGHCCLRAVQQVFAGFWSSITAIRQWIVPHLEHIEKDPLKLKFIGELVYDKTVTKEFRCLRGAGTGGSSDEIGVGPDYWYSLAIIAYLSGRLDDHNGQLQVFRRFPKVQENEAIIIN